MNLQIDTACAKAYTGKTQIVRVCTEAWGEQNFYCPACMQTKLARTPNNQKAIDYRCVACDEVYQLKSGAKIGQRIVDAAHDAMIAQIRSDSVPNLFYLNYTADWNVKNLMLIPSFFFTESCIKARPPLKPPAKRVGWVGCEIMLNQIAPEGKLWMVRDGEVTSAKDVRRQYAEVKPLAAISVGMRGWTLDVLRVIHRIGRREFHLTDVYAFEDELAALHPANQNVQPKIRQRLQGLVRAGLVERTSPGNYRLT